MRNASVRNKKRRDDSKWRNANSRLTRECVDLLTGLTAELGEADPESAGDVFALDYLRSEYLSKYNDGTKGQAALRKYRAVHKWLETEKRNAETNRRLRSLDRGYNILPRVTFYSFLRIAQQIIKDVLGPLSDELALGTFSGGASTSRRKTESHPGFKFVGEAHTTIEARRYVGMIYHVAPLLREYGTFDRCKVVDGAVLFTVPKKSDIDRCACKEPDVNMFLQKGVGLHIRKRLRKFGVNLNDQSVNRSLAKRGSIDASLATLDLSSASDTMTISCVEALLPHDWFLYLNDIRSQRVVVGNSVGRTEMFSSMGNGFTFELESLIFYALTRTVAYFAGVSGIISVYGDDIIFPVEIYDSVTWVLGVFGFRANPDKSFASGPFRESCGGHYYSGADVTPFYLRKPPTRLTDLIRIANRLRKWLLTEGREYTTPSGVKAWLKLRSYVPVSLWGGDDLEADTQLVTDHLPKLRLQRIRVEKLIPDQGQYLFDHRCKWNHTEEPEEPAFPAADTTQKCRLRRVKLGISVDKPLFHEEICDEWNTDSS